MRDDRMNRQNHDSAQTDSRLRRRGKGGETKQKKDVGNSVDDSLSDSGRDAGSPGDRWEGERGIDSPEEEFGGGSGGNLAAASLDGENNDGSTEPALGGESGHNSPKPSLNGENGPDFDSPASDPDSASDPAPAPVPDGASDPAPAPAPVPDGASAPDSPCAPDSAAPSANPSTPMEVYRIPPRKWFLTFMYMNIPLIGWIYLLAKAFGRKNTQLKDFARAYLLYKLLFLLVALIILGLAVYVGLGLLDEVLAYMEML